MEKVVSGMTMDLAEELLEAHSGVKHGVVSLEWLRVADWMLDEASGGISAEECRSVFLGLDEPQEVPDGERDAWDRVAHAGRRALAQISNVLSRGAF